jgi:hypothetical protein
MKTTGIEPVTVRLVARCLNQRRHCVPPPPHQIMVKLISVKNVKVYVERHNFYNSCYFDVQN